MGIIKIRKKSYIKFKILLSIIIIVCILIAYFIYLEKKVTPIVLAIGELRAQQITVIAINESVQIVLKDNIKYNDLISITEDFEGSVAMMQANTFLMNKVASDIALTIQEHFKQVKETIEKIPLGNILGSQFFAQYGPKIKLNVVPLGKVDVNFGTEFEDAGINQTRHTIYLIIKTDARVMVPFSSNDVHVTTYFPIAETVIVGKVPKNYISVPENQFLNITPLYE